MNGAGHDGPAFILGVVMGKTFRIGMLAAIILGTGVLTQAATQTKTPAKSTTAKTTSAHKTGKKKTRKASWRTRGQKKIDSDRTRQIQEALVREHYLDSEPSGVWDMRSQKAMEKYQADNGWQSKTIPDSRALIKLGLGPDRGKLLNPETAMTSPLETHAATRAAETKPETK